VPVNKHGRQTTEYARIIDGTYSGNAQVLYFPAGICSRKIKGQITDPRWNKNFIQKAVQYKRDVVPIYFEGRNSNFFYNLANIRKNLCIKAHIEMTFLVDELFKQKGRHFHLKFCTPMPYAIFDKSKNYQQWAEVVREKVYALQG
jgi:putative hemolysin